MNYSEEQKQPDLIFTRKMILFLMIKFICFNSSSYNFVKQITRIFNPNLLTQPIFKTLDIAIPILTPLVNIDQLVSLIAGIPRGTIDNIVNSINEINNFLTTPTSTRVNKLNSKNLFQFSKFR